MAQRRGLTTPPPSPTTRSSTPDLPKTKRVGDSPATEPYSIFFPDVVTTEQNETIHKTTVIEVLKKDPIYNTLLKKI